MYRLGCRPSAAWNFTPAVTIIGLQKSAMYFIRDGCLTPRTDFIGRAFERSRQSGTATEKGTDKYSFLGTRLSDSAPPQEQCRLSHNLIDKGIRVPRHPDVHDMRLAFAETRLSSIRHLHRSLWRAVYSYLRNQQRGASFSCLNIKNENTDTPLKGLLTNGLTDSFHHIGKHIVR